MANIRLKELIEANVDPKLVARSKETGKLVYFKSPENKAAALKAGSHTDPKDKKGGEPKVDAKPNDMFGGDYAKDRGTSDSNWMDDLDKIDTSDVKGKADPNADSFTSGDLYGATFKDPQTGKTITVGDAYEREDDSEAYKKAFAYVSKFDPDKEAVMGTQAYDDLNKKAPSKDDVDISGYKTDGEGKVLYKGKKVADYMYDDITDELTLKTKDGIKVFDTHNDMYKYLQKNKSENPSLSSKLMSMFKK